MDTETKKQIDELSGTATTGHDWDGIRELDTPMPRWWLWTFYLCIIWAVGYWVLFPAWPLPGGPTRRWSSPGAPSTSARAATIATAR